MGVEPIPNFVGGSFPPYANIQGLFLTRNYYTEHPLPGGARGALIGTPGYALWLDLPSGPGRAIFEQDGRAFAISGPLFCEIFPQQTFTVRGVVEVDANPATISSNGLDQGKQIFVVSAGHGYIYDLTLNTFTDVSSQSTFPFPAQSGFYLDGYFGAIGQGQPTFSLSNLFDGTIWNILQGGEQQLSLTVDNIQNGAAINGKVWFLQSKNTEIWADIGAADFPLAPIPGALPRWGCAAPWTLCAVDNALMGVGTNEDGSLEVIRANGYDWKVVSTPAISHILQTVKSSISGARAWTYAQQGHAFYLLYVPGLTTTLVYDVTTNDWHERAMYDELQMDYVPDLGIGHAYAFGKHLVIDRQSGAIYEMDLSFLTFDVVLT
jgi:hypothetical protein